ncbi:hypothetical protein SteCoe_19382 [Stentor coeruleus]|uniref:Uncharacterized protein n=1 Tax=Stentor coeruleus TaxID=5963 RepID=A0A1R2BUQ3_9CILI|nr:hypothetical protein SteCoe_19382 [Stentor coeruleus]
MELPPLNDISELNLGDTKSFVKFREISGSNIFPTMIISSIESLIIKKCFPFAFEVFFGVLFEIGERLDAKMDESPKRALAEFTCAIQTKKLSKFRELQRSREFYSFINDIGNFFDFSDDYRSVKIIKDLLKKIKVTTFIHKNAIEEHIQSDMVYTTINVLNYKKKMYMLYEINDFMDDEEIRIQEEETKLKIERAEKLRKAEEARLEKQRKEEEERKKNKRIYEETLKKIEAQKLAERQRLERDKEFRRQNSLLEKQKKIEEESERKRLIELERKRKEEEDIRLKEEKDKRIKEEEEEKKRIQEENEKRKNEEELQRLKEEEEERLRQEEERYLRIQASTPELCSSPSAESPTFIDPELIEESKLLESLSLICGSCFCTVCYRMLKRSSLFLKCSSCCDKAFIKPLAKPVNHPRASLPKGSICVGCDKSITKGEIIKCICCYIKSEFLNDNNPTSCYGCCNPETINWVDTYTGHKYEMIKCGFCERKVNYLYVIEVCTTCHDQICLHCLRKNNFIAVSVCSECHSRREVNPYRQKVKPKRVC